MIVPGVNSSIRAITYPPNTLQRAELALSCSPFQVKLLDDMRSQGVSILKIAGRSGVGLGYTQSPLNELVAESELVWLIQAGLLRREVDGQGLTDSFRLTPLGLQLLGKWQGVALSKPRKRDRLRNFSTRWLRSLV